MNTIDAEKLIAALERHIAYWRTAQDPYQIGNAVMVALEEVKLAIEEASRTP